MWGEETGEDLYNGAEVGPDGGRQVEEQVDTNTTADYLREAYGTLVEAEDVGNENLAELGAQREVLQNIGRNVDRIHHTLDETDRKITQMENPWAIGPVITKSSGGKGYVPTTVGAAAHASRKSGEGYNMKGDVYKQSRWLKQWNQRYFKQDGDVIHYYCREKDSKPRGHIRLRDAVLHEMHYNETKKDNCFSITEAATKVTTIIHVEKDADYNTWLSCIGREISGDKSAMAATAATAKPKTDFAAAAANRAKAYGGGTGRTMAKFGDDVENELLDHVIDKLDKLDGIGRTMESEIEDQTRIIGDITGKVGGADERLIKNSNRVRNI